MPQSRQKSYALLAADVVRLRLRRKRDFNFQVDDFLKAQKKANQNVRFF
jgi:hypothetical protein